VKPHPGPSFDCEPSQTHSLEGGPDDLLSRPQPVEARHLGYAAREPRARGQDEVARRFPEPPEALLAYRLALFGASRRPRPEPPCELERTVGHMRQASAPLRLRQEVGIDSVA